MQLEVGDVLFIHGTDAIERGIEWFESFDHNKAAAQFSHVCIYLGRGLLLESQGFRLHSVGVYPVTEYPVVSVKRAVVPLSDMEQKEIILAALGEMHDGYDYPEIVCLLLRYAWKLKIAFHARKLVECAELVIRLYDAIHRHLSDDPSPAGLWMSPALQDVGTYQTRELIAA